MPCIGVKFVHRVGGRFSTPNGLTELLQDREVDASDGDVIEVSISVVPAAEVTKRRSLMAWLRKIGDAPDATPEDAPCARPVGEWTSTSRDPAAR